MSNNTFIYYRNNFILTWHLRVISYLVKITCEVVVKQPHSYL